MDDSNFNFKNLYVLDLANNHQGSLEHGKKIINYCADLAERYNVRVGIKFQFRDLPDFVHISEQKKATNKHVPRFLSTILPWEDYQCMLDLIKERGLLSICTPFDEPSAKKIKQMKFDIIKVASCSAKDWPLLEAIADTALPVIASTGGLVQSEVDSLVSFLQHKGCDFSLMHCVSVYPTPDHLCNLRNISLFKERYPNLTIGWSTHEPPEDIVHVGLAKAAGAEMYERHVGLEAEEITLNKYSSNPSQLENWLKASVRAEELLGKYDRQDPCTEEVEAIDGLKRGIFVKKDFLKKGTVLQASDIYFAFPYQDAQLSSGEWKEGIKITRDYKKDESISSLDIVYPDHSSELIIKHAIHEAKALLSYARIPLSHEFTTEYSHHYGISKFRETGVVLINVINREYAKKILVQLKGQKHPMHYHKLKEETFIVVYGELISNLDGEEKLLKPGEKLTVPPGVWHKFRTETGCVFEEISTTAFSDDSVYRDPEINKLTSEQRKTVVDHWGRFQIKNQLL